MPKRFSFDAKLERAKQHILDFQKAEEVFLQNEPYAVVPYCEVDSRDYVLQFRVFEDCPDPIVAIIGDAMHNMRSALDHLVFQVELSNQRRPDRRTQFPIYEDLVAFNNTRPEREVRYGTAFTQLIDAMKPYRGGNPVLVGLHDLDIIDKHRLFITTNYSNTRVGMFGNVRRQDLVSDGAHDARLLGSSFVGPLESGKILYRCPNGEPEVKMEFGFSIALGEVWESLSVRGAFSTMFNFVKGTLESFRPLL